MMNHHNAKMDISAFVKMSRVNALLNHHAQKDLSEFVIMGRVLALTLTPNEIHVKNICRRRVSHWDIK